MRYPLIVVCAWAMLQWTVVGALGVSDNMARCYPADTRRAVTDLRRVAGWNDFYDSYKRYSRCDAGRVAEEYSYALGRLLAREWKDVNLLLRLAVSDPAFKQFVLKHIDENVPEEESQVIIRNAREQCPSDGEWLCKAIVDY